MCNDGSSSITGPSGDGWSSVVLRISTRRDHAAADGIEPSAHSGTARRGIGGNHRFTRRSTLAGPCGLASTTGRGSGPAGAMPSRLGARAKPWNRGSGFVVSAPVERGLDQLGSLLRRKASAWPAQCTAGH